MSVKLPGPQNRIVIVGSTGTGKTVAGLWHLSNADLLDRPWVMIDFKGDENIAKLAAKELSLDQVPKKPGLYVYRPIPEYHDAAIRALFWRFWSQENIGVFTDEGSNLASERNKNPGLQACLSQGRSKNIQMITCSQRPVWMTRSIFSESDYFQVFRLNDRRDYDNVQQMISVDIRSRLPPYYSHYYDVARNEAVIFKPVPARESIIEKINARLRSNMRTI